MKSLQFYGVRQLPILSVFSMFVFAPMAEAGSCTYIQENMFAGPFDACREPVDERGCAEVGQEGSNKNAVHSQQGCPKDADKVVGRCDNEGVVTYYYSGAAEDLEVGCGFVGGNWQ